MSIICKDLGFSFGEDNPIILSHLNLELSKEHITVLSGKSGFGKSTLLYLAAGLYPSGGGKILSGSITVEGENPAKLKPQKRCRLVSMMFQNPEMQFCMDTVENELVFCLENMNTDINEIPTRVAEALSFLNISDLRTRKLQSLSGGEKQKVMLACIYLFQPQWILLDEPFANIDASASVEIAEKLKELHSKKRIGILAVDHHLEHWMQIADKLCIIQKDAQTKQDAVIAMDFSALDPVFIKQLGVAFPGEHYEIKNSEIENTEIENTEIEKRLHTDISKQTSPILSLQDFSVSYGAHKVWKKSSVDFYPGKVYAITGESGSGKSTLFHSILGITPYKGKIFFQGKELKKRHRLESGAIGFVTQNPQDQFIADSVREELLEGLNTKRSAKIMFSEQRKSHYSLSKTHTAKLTLKEKEEQVETILKRINLWRYREVSPYMLSQGQQRKLGVAALMTYPCQILICDEPTYAQDLQNTEAIMSILLNLVKENGITLIFSTHDRQLALDAADQIYELKEGQLHEIH